VKSVSAICAVVLSGFLLGLGGQANAAVYWGNVSSIGRSNLDLTLANPYFIGAVNSVDISSACGVAVDETHIYWAERFGHAIGRSNLDGSSPDYSFITGVAEPCGVAVDETYIYWASGGGNAIGRAKLDGSQRIDAFIGVTDPCGVAVDDKFIYWASAAASYVGRALIDSGVQGPRLYEGTGDFALCGVDVNEQHVFWGGFGNVIGRANLNGSNPDASFITGVTNPCSVAVGENGLYWTEQEGVRDEQPRIGRANLDGTVTHRDAIAGLRFPCGIALDSIVVPPPGPPPPPPPSVCRFSVKNRMRSNGGLSIALSAPVRGSIEVLTKGLRWRIVTPQAPPWLGGNRVWSLRIWPGSKGQAARRIRTRLRRVGRAAVKLRIKCDGEKESPTVAARRVWLGLKKKNSQKNA